MLGRLAPILPSPSASSIKNRLSSSDWPDSKSARAQYSRAFAPHCFARPVSSSRPPSAFLSHNTCSIMINLNSCFACTLWTYCCCEATSSTACSRRTVAFRYRTLAASQSSNRSAWTASCATDAAACTSSIQRRCVSWHVAICARASATGAGLVWEVYIPPSSCAACRRANTLPL